MKTGSPAVGERPHGTACHLRVVLI